MMRTRRRSMPVKTLLTIISLMLCLWGIMWNYLPAEGARYFIPASGAAVLILAALWNWDQKRQMSDFANDICETLDALMDEREPENYQPYEDSAVSKVQGKLLQYYEKMKDGRLQSVQDKQTIQELVSDISHQVKTPIASIRMFTGILQQHRLTDEKRMEFLGMMEGQINKLEFLMQSLIKMSRLETGTFVLHMEEKNLYTTIAEAVGAVWAKAERKNIQIDVECDSCVLVRHDEKWTAEALGNILDNAVKYTPRGGDIHVTVRPWQFYTRVDITDTGMGISKEHYHDVFQRFYRAQEAAPQEGVGLGLYLARGIITRQKGYISVTSCIGRGSTFSVYLPS
ncbi:HAMP domain-containing histidine kinase [Ruminococcus sp. OA3]|uniref:sensor histidine kinase n=1 Tax=Ruminococcus sp. OA3 TaxID=2914164 RepID=UPI001F0523C9|nr:HAMP domain-containing sensor histidine kinase [Ruminococcus sp. OA3]MCH1982860.1 HAMP domain-containing histidine kinase [Ruminococcus sp. OA3]